MKTFEQFVQSIKVQETFEPRNIKKREQDMKALMDKKVSEIQTLLNDPKFGVQIEYSIHTNDIHDAIVGIQDYLGIEHGDTAGMYFSGHDIESVWQTYTPKERLDVLVGYIAREIDVEYINLDGKTGTVAASDLVRKSFIKHGLL